MNESCIKEDPIYIVSGNFPLNCIFSLHIMQFIKAHGLKNAFWKSTVFNGHEQERQLYVTETLPLQAPPFPVPHKISNWS